MSDQRSSPSIICAIAAAFLAVLLVAAGIIICQRLALVRPPIESSNVVDETPGPEPGRERAIDIIFGNGGAITDLGEGVVEARFFVDDIEKFDETPIPTEIGAVETPPPVSTTETMTGTVSSVSPITVRVTSSQANERCTTSETLAKIELHVKPARGIEYDEQMSLSGPGYEVVLGDTQHEMNDLMALCATGAWMELRIRRSCRTSDGQVQQRDGSRGMLVAYIGCYQGRILQLGDPSGIIDQPLIEGGTPTCKNNTYKGQTVTLREVQGWTAGFTNPNGDSPASGKCYTVDNHTGAWSWHTASEAGSATVVAPSPGAQPGNSMSLTQSGTFGFYASASKCYFVEFTTNGCTYYSDIVAVPPDPQSPAQPQPPNPAKLITNLNMHLPSGTGCQTLAPTCP